MSDDTLPPLDDEVDTEDLSSLLDLFFKKQMQDVDNMLPCTVLSFNGDRNNPKVSVKPDYLVTKTDGSTMPMADIAEIPVYQPSAGGFILSFPIKAGDKGWIKANDQDMSLFHQSKEAARGNTKRMHSFEDGVFFPDTMQGFTVDGEDQERVVLQSKDGKSKLAMDTDKVIIKVGSTELEINEQGLTVKTASNTFNFGAGGFGGDAKITTTDDVEAGNVSLKDHVHGGITPGGSNTGVPV